MKFELFAALLCSSLAVGPAAAEISPKPGPGDPHIQTVDYDPEQLVVLRVAVNYALTVEFSPDERIENVSLGNSGVWQVTANKSANRIFVKPVQMSVDTDMVVVTDTRSYAFELRAIPSADASMAYVVRFTYPRAPQPQELLTAPQKSAYRFGGARALRPLAMSDDGHATTITWPARTPIPVVSIVGSDGKESLANGAVRDGVYVIDDIADSLTFRAGGKVASATRYIPKAPRR